MPTTEASTIHHQPGIREHRRRFRLDGGQATARLASALKALEDNHEALQLAFEANRCTTPEKSLADVKAAVRLLVDGPNGQFRGCR